jgi:hypothetical protein
MLIGDLPVFISQATQATQTKKPFVDNKEFSSFALV